MKNYMLIFIAFFISGTAFSQIEVKDFDRKAQANIDQMDKVEVVEATSSCGEVRVETKDEQFSGGCLGTIVRTYTFSDDCGNTAEAQQYINLMDTTAPQIDNVPENMKINNSSEVPAAPELSASDNSGKPVEVTMEETKSDKKITRRWTAIDQCGNKTVEQQIITLKGA